MWGSEGDEFCEVSKAAVVDKCDKNEGEEAKLADGRSVDFSCYPLVHNGFVDCGHVYIDEGNGCKSGNVVVSERTDEVCCS